jgi:outer membrane protein insertion porin family
MERSESDLNDLSRMSVKRRSFYLLLEVVRWFALGVLLLVAFPPAVALAQGEDARLDPMAAIGLEGQTVTAIRVEGNRRVEPQSVIRQLRTQAGEPLNLKVLTSDIGRIWRLGYFEDVKVDAQPNDRGVELVILVVEKPAIASVTFEGRDNLSEDDIKEVVNLKKFQILDVSKVKSNAEKIRELYLEKGYYLAEVDYEIRPHEEYADQSHVVFIIHEYAKVQVKQITFLGNKAIKDDELTKIMGTREGDWFSFITSFGNFQEEAFEGDLQRLTAYYYDKGYVQVEVGVPTVRLSRDKRFLYITIQISEGPRFKVGDVDLQGDFILPKEELYEKTKLRSGEFFSYGTLRKDLEKLRNLYQDVGYAYVNVNPLTRVDPTEKIVHVTYDIQKGSKVYFGRIEVTGNAKTRDKVIRRELVIEEGILYSNKQLELSKQRVQRLGFFENVEITTQRGERDDVINVQVKVTERPTGTFQAGLGFSSTENILANIQLSQNNLFGRGQVLTIQGQRSGIRTLFNLRFSEPYLFDTKTRFSVSGYRFDFLYPDYQQQSTGGNVSLGYPLLQDYLVAKDLSFSVTYKLEDVVITPGGRTARDARQIGSLFRGGVTSSVSGALFFDSRDNRLFPTKGQFHSARVEFADDIVTRSETEFVKYDLETRYYFPLFWQFVLRLNGQLGYITNIDPNKSIPLQERYLVGGPNTIRGFRRFSLGPTRTVASNSSDPGTVGSEFRIGGNKQLLLTAEVEFPIFTAINLKGVLFADAGNAFGEGQSYTLVPDLVRPDINDYEDALRTAVGFGFRWFSPIGLLRFEWGIPLQRLRDEEPLVFEFSIGNAF